MGEGIKGGSVYLPLGSDVEKRRVTYFYKPTVGDYCYGHYPICLIKSSMRERNLICLTKASPLRWNASLGFIVEPWQRWEARWRFSIFRLDSLWGSWLLSTDLKKFGAIVNDEVRGRNCLTSMEEEGEEEEEWKGEEWRSIGEKNISWPYGSIQF